MSHPFVRLLNTFHIATPYDLYKTARGVKVHPSSFKSLWIFGIVRLRQDRQRHRLQHHREQYGPDVPMSAVSPTPLSSIIALF